MQFQGTQFSNILLCNSEYFASVTADSVLKMTYSISESRPGWSLGSAPTCFRGHCCSLADTLHARKGPIIHPEMRAMLSGTDSLLESILSPEQLQPCFSRFSPGSFLLGFPMLKVRRVCWMSGPCDTDAPHCTQLHLFCLTSIMCAPRSNGHLRGARGGLSTSPEDKAMPGHAGNSRSHQNVHPFVSVLKSLSVLHIAHE